MGKPIIIVTPTYKRENQLAYIKRACSIFRHVDDLIWILIGNQGEEDNCNLKKILKKSRIKHFYLTHGTFTDKKYFSKANYQRNHALSIIKYSRIDGIVYFADDDNFWDIRLFDEIRKTKRISIFPVAIKGRNGIEKPIVFDGKIVGWDCGYLHRKYPVDMGAFAFSTDILKEIKFPFFPLDSGSETEFLEKFVKDKSEFEILCNDCNDCYIFHNEPL